MANLRDLILSANDIKSEKVHVDVWDVDLEIRGLTGKERAELLQQCFTPQGGMDLEKMYPLLAIMSVHDPETGEKVFQPEDRDALNEKSGAALEQIAQVAMKLSGMEPDSFDNALKN